MAAPTNRNKWLIRIVLGLATLGLIGVAAVWYIFNEKHADTASEKAAYSLNAFDLINEFKKSDSTANKKYIDKIVEVKGKISSIEPVDSTMNVKMIDSSENYVIFAFQAQDFDKVKKLKEGQNVSIKGSCSGGTYSEILDTRYIAFNRCAIIQ